MPFFDEPLAGFAAADDPYFAELKKPGVIGEHFLLPRDWLREAKTVVSVFFPHTKQVKTANRKNKEWPADEWLHARIEGQAFIAGFCRHITAFLKDQGFDCIAPALDPRFSTKSPLTADTTQQDYYTSNWSERHAAHVCGLGTFGLSRGLITARGVSGRFASFITTACFEPTPRPYSGTQDYCTRCGACALRCPAKAISLEAGKNHPPCSQFLDRTTEKYRPRYGCGKCQTGVPCENGIPKR
ncbi:(Fe-S)-binding protein [Spirochaetia bacterium]|nr:(Fe-S)-binding protein [Spirochaetia bacterium]